MSQVTTSRSNMHRLSTNLSMTILIVTLLYSSIIASAIPVTRNFKPHTTSLSPDASQLEEAVIPPPDESADEGVSGVDGMLESLRDLDKDKSSIHSQKPSGSFLSAYSYDDPEPKDFYDNTDVEYAYRGDISPAQLKEDEQQSKVKDPDHDEHESDTVLSGPSLISFEDVDDPENYINHHQEGFIQSPTFKERFVAGLHRTGEALKHASIKGGRAMVMAAKKSGRAIHSGASAMKRHAKKAGDYLKNKSKSIFNHWKRRFTGNGSN